MTASRARLVVAMVLVAAAAAGAAAAALPVRGSYAARLTGDEPHYLVTAISIAEDASLDVSDEMRAQRYRPFHEAGLRSQAAERDGRMIVPHDPLLPALLALPMRAGGWVAAKLTLAALAGALAALLVWTAVRRLGVSVARAAIVVVAFTAAGPLAVYGAQVYPELPAALATAGAIAALTGPPTRRALVVVWAAIVALPWLGTKYVFVAAALTAVAAVAVHRARGRRASLAFLGSLALAGVAYAVAHQAWYGGWTPYAAGAHFVEDGELSVVGESLDPLGRSTRLVALLTDRRFGIAAWTPAYLLAVPAVAALLTRRPRGWAAIAAPLAAGWLTATFVALTMHGWWWPGRHVVVALPAIVLAVAWWVGAEAPRGRARLGLVAGLGLVGLVTYAWLVTDGLRGEIAFAVDFFRTRAPTYRALRALLPDYADRTVWTWVAHAGWTAAAVAGLWWGRRSVEMAQNDDGAPGGDAAVERAQLSR